MLRLNVVVSSLSLSSSFVFFFVQSLHCNKYNCKYIYVYVQQLAPSHMPIVSHWIIPRCIFFIMLLFFLSLQCNALKSIITWRLIPLIWMMCWVIYLRCIYWLALPIWYAIIKIHYAFPCCLFLIILSSWPIRLSDLSSNNFILRGQTMSNLAHFLLIAVQSTLFCA